MPRASSLEQAIKEKFGTDAEVSLIAGTNGVFEISVDGRLVFSKKQLGRFPEESEVMSLLR